MIKYSFTREGIKAFSEDTLGDIFDEMDRGGDHIDDHDIYITIGEREIRLPICADAHNGIIDLLEQLEEEENQ